MNKSTNMFEPIKVEIKAWRTEMSECVSSLKDSSLHFDDTNVLAVLTSFIGETYNQLPKTLTLITVASILGCGITELVQWMM